RGQGPSRLCVRWWATRARWRVPLWTLAQWPRRRLPEPARERRASGPGEWRRATIRRRPRPRQATEPLDAFRDLEACPMKSGLNTGRGTMANERPLREPDGDPA